MDDVRNILLNLLGKETVSTASKKASRGLRDVGDAAEGAERDSEGLNKALLETHRALTKLQDDARRADDPLSFMRDINKRKRELTNLKKLFADAGDDSASGFGASFVARVGPLLARAPISPPLIAAVAAAGPGIGAAMSAAVLAGLSGGVVAAGVKVALSDPRVQKEAEATGAMLGRELRDGFGKSFGPATVAAMRTVRKEVAGLRPELEKLGDAGAAFVAPLTRGAVGLAKEALPGITNAVSESGAVVRKLEQSMILLGRAGGQAMDSIGDGAAGAALALGDLAAATSLAVQMFGTSISGMSKLFTLMRVASAPDRNAVIVELAQGEAASAAFKAELEKLKGSLDGSGRSAEDAANALAAWNRAAEEAAGNTLNAEQAALRSAESWDDLKIAIKEAREDGKLTSEEFYTLNGQVLDYAENVLAASKATYEQTGSQDAANAILDRGRENFIEAGIAAGRNADEVKNLADKLFGIPGKRQSDIVVNKQAAEKALNAINAAANRAARTRYLNIIASYTSPRQSGALGAVGQIPREKGGPVRQGEAYIVGEKRPEVFVPNSNGMIYPSIEKFQGMHARTARSAGPQVIEMRSGGSRMDDLLIEMFLRALRTRPDLRAAVRRA